jgi:hypothetical protein
LVALAPPLAKLTVRMPPVLVYVAKVAPPVCRFDPLMVNPDAFKLNVSTEAASATPPLVNRLTVSVEPFQLAPSFSVSVTVALEPTSRVSEVPEVQATLSPFRLVITGAVLVDAVIELLLTAVSEPEVAFKVRVLVVPVTV